MTISTKRTLNRGNCLELAKFLETPDLKQTTGMLHINDCFCLLGAACEVYRQNTKRGRWEVQQSSSGNQMFQFITANDHNISTLPQEVINWYGFDSDLPYSPVSDRSSPFFGTISYSGLNDGGFTFPQIANILRYHTTIPD
jgi:hypothetical protein